MSINAIRWKITNDSTEFAESVTIDTFIKVFLFIN